MSRLKRRLNVLAMATAVTALGAMLSGSPASAAVPAAGVAATGPATLSLTAESNFDSRVYKSVRIFCPAGMQVIGGGYNLSGAEGAVVLDDFIPSATDLLVGAGEIVGPGESPDGTTASWKIVATVVCATTLPGYSVQPASSGIARIRTQRAEASCPPGRALIGGGASLSNGFGQVSIRNLTIGTSSVTAEAITDLDGYTDSWSVTAYAICAASPLAGWHVVPQATPNDPTVPKVVTAFCPPGQIAVGSGWFTDGFTWDRLVTRSVVNGDPDPGATAAGVQVAPDRAWVLRADAVCIDRT